MEILELTTALTHVKDLGQALLVIVPAVGLAVAALMAFLEGA